jgi:hypothetical protein
MTGPIDPSRPRKGFIIEAKRRSGTTLFKFAEHDEALVAITTELTVRNEFKSITWRPVE